jgi:hypothetical protein
LSRDEQVVRANRLAFPFQAGTNPGRGLRRCAVKRELDDGGDESLDLLPLLGWGLRPLNAAEQFVNRDHRNSAVGWGKLAQPFTMPGHWRSTPMQVSVSSRRVI